MPILLGCGIRLFGGLSSSIKINKVKKHINLAWFNLNTKLIMNYSENSDVVLDFW